MKGFIRVRVRDFGDDNKVWGFPSPLWRGIDETWEGAVVSTLFGICTLVLEEFDLSTQHEKV